MCARAELLGGGGDGGGGIWEVVAAIVVRVEGGGNGGDSSTTHDVIRRGARFCAIFYIARAKSRWTRSCVAKIVRRDFDGRFTFHSFYSLTRYSPFPLARRLPLSAR